ncbi:MAG TPA: POTRA domain-containing protein [Gemmataceae bacterium]|nr:POTRA domain-containing protein [Gemmataceae bacterium]
MMAFLLAWAVAAAQKEPDRVGRILIEGNTDTPNRVILSQLDFRPGQILQYPQLDAARKQLAKLGLFDATDPPAVEVLPNEFGGQFKDIRVRVTERSGNWALFAVIDGVEGVLTLDVRQLRETAVTVMKKLNGKE